MKKLSACLVLMLLVGCAHSHRHHDRHPASQRYVHVVFFWLKQPGNEADRQKIIQAGHGFVGKIPGLVSVQSGRVKPSTRPVVDSSYDVGLVMVFEDEKSLMEYGPHPVHQQAAKEVILPLVERFVVYDFADEKGKGTPK